MRAELFVVGPFVAMRTVQIAEQRRLDHAVKQMLAPKGVKVPPPVNLADDAALVS